MLLNLLAIFTAFATTQASTDRNCGSNWNNLWLDIVIVVDNSKGMTNEGITEVAANIATTFASGPRIGTDYSDPRSTRLSILTYNSEATVVADLNQFQSADDVYQTLFSFLNEVSDSDDSFLAKGLGMAESVLYNGRMNGVRENYNRLVVVYASAYREDGEDPLNIAKRLRSSGVAIATVAFDPDGDGLLLSKLSKIASPNMSFKSRDPNLVGKIQAAALQTNCFCPRTWIQYRPSYDDEKSYKFGICIRAETITASWASAKIACQNSIKYGYLVTEFDDRKHDFLFRIALNNAEFTEPYAYHTGLSYVNGAWRWQQPEGHPLILQNGSYSHWNPTYPNTPFTNTVVVNHQHNSNLDVGWQNINGYRENENYMCEVASCDTDKYCD